MLYCSIYADYEIQVWFILFILCVIVAGPCLYESGLIPKKLGFMEDAEVLNYGIGMSNIVPRTTRSANELSRSMRNKTISLYYN